MSTIEAICIEKPYNHLDFKVGHSYSVVSVDEYEDGAFNLGIVDCNDEVVMLFYSDLKYFFKFELTLEEIKERLEEAYD